MKRNMPRVRTEELTRQPAHPVAGPQLFRRLRAALTMEFGAAPTFKQLENIFGQPRTSIQNWFQFDHPHIQFFLGLLEQLPQPRRLELLAEFCRDLPLLSHPRLAHDPIAATKLETLLKRKSGFTLISGGTDYQRTFVLTALGQAFIRSTGWASQVTGVDLHEPLKFVPVSGVVYAGQMLVQARLQKCVHQVWPEIASSDARLLLLNGIWSAVPDLRTGIAKLAVSRHVIMADASAPASADLVRASGVTTNVITVGSSKANPAWIQVQITAG